VSGRCGVWCAAYGGPRQALDGPTILVDLLLQREWERASSERRHTQRKPNRCSSQK
jgi:hypothetical protein